MDIFMILILLTLSIDVVQCWFCLYPFYCEFRDDGDTGEPTILTEYIEKEQLELAKNLSSVNHDDMKWLSSYAGYLTVDKEYSSNLFFWFFPAESDQAKAPVVLWLDGGPGVSSLYGLFQENGPFFVTKKKQLQPRKYSWHLNHNLLYIDNPVGTGFSFTDNDAGYAKNQEDIAKNLLNALRQFFTLFSELRGNSFYITGESYAGKYVPALAYAIYRNNSNSRDPKDKINLQGLAIGNRLSDPINQVQYGDYLYQLGLIDSNGLKTFKDVEKEIVDCIEKRDFEGAYRVFHKLIDGDETTNGSSIFKNLTDFNSYFNYLKPHADESDDVSEFVQMSPTRKAIHVGNNTFHDLKSIKKVDEHLRGDIMTSVTDWIAELLEHYKVLIYSGQMDIIVPYPLTVNYLKKLKFNAAEEYKTAKRHTWKVDNEIAGYVKHAGNLTEVLVRNAGHMAPADQPKWVLDMLLRMTTGEGFFENSELKLK